MQGPEIEAARPAACGDRPMARPQPEPSMRDIERPVDKLPLPDSGPVPLEGQMSASITAAPARSSFGRIPSAFAALALVVVLAVSVALVAMNGTKAAPITTSPKGAPP